MHLHTYLFLTDCRASLTMPIYFQLSAYLEHAVGMPLTRVNFLLTVYYTVCGYHVRRGAKESLAPMILIIDFNTIGPHLAQ